ncbi:similar to Saccharomyces cerevisiae YBL057C PTH2 One of two (see also PTH1) mitochondrially-localized peptidyl-tRNA hydrolases [Maudiozyma saulgeensis]|uniref:peptidyl-tRNA hydrolase n=1 Tax=Maudiozyma saulgeensis TaxID=1789683 RepID=A0A1X7R5U0_9SACH|nr:similar to Saccharomyces cerevisiae YBL057C PTH2 One of two (see also PTH1) mitochondrially-localized peptidyl-tRNA hydrolases [Kazachstania saulgeensis]
MSNLNSNIPTYFGIAFVALATGFYLGQTIPQLTSQEDEKRSHQKKESKKLSTNIENITDEEYPESEESEEEEEEEEEESDYEIESLALNDIPGEVRMALVIRTDLKMEKGKVAAQCAHAALGCFRLIATDPSKKSYNPVLTNRWLHGGQAKITLKCQNKEMMDELYAKALSLDVNAVVIHDAGRTQIAAGSATVLGIGPAPKSVLDQITGDLKLY